MLPPTSHYFANAVGSVDFLPNAYVYLHWSGAPLSSPEFRALYVHARNLLERHQLTALLADHRDMPAAPDAADREWLLAEWLPQAVIQSPFAHYAVIPTLTPEHRLHTEEVLNDLSYYVSVGRFDDLAQAAAWVNAAQLEAN